MTQPNKPTLDETLMILAVANITREHPTLTNDAHSSIAQAIEEIIGEDPQYSGTHMVTDKRTHDYLLGQRELRAEQRQRLTAYLNPKEEEE